MKNFSSMSKKIWKEDGKIVTSVLSRKFTNVQVKNEKEFLDKISLKLERYLSKLAGVPSSKLEFDTFWLKRKLQLRANKNNPDYILYVVKLISKIPLELFEEEWLSDEKEKELVELAYEAFKNNLNASENDDTEYEKVIKEMELDEYFDNQQLSY